MNFFQLPTTGIISMPNAQNHAISMNFRLLFLLFWFHFHCTGIWIRLISATSLLTADVKVIKSSKYDSSSNSFRLKRKTFPDVAKYCSSNKALTHTRNLCVCVSTNKYGLSLVRAGINKQLVHIKEEEIIRSKSSSIWIRIDDEFAFLFS